MRKHASLIIAMLLVMLVISACLVRTHPTRRQSQPVYVEKHKKQKKHKKHKVKHRKHRH